MALTGTILIILICLIITFTLLGTLLWSEKNSPGLFVVCGNNDAQIGWSEDGDTWSQSVYTGGGLPFGVGGQALDVKNRNNIWVASGVAGTDRTRQLLWSDGPETTWMDSTGDQFSDDENARGRFVEYGGGIWVAGGTPNTIGGNTLLYSYDGKDWTAPSSYTGSTPFGATADATVSAIQYINDLWLVGGNYGSGGANNPKLLYSDNGIDWLPASGTPFGNTDDNANPIKFSYGNGVYVAVGQNSAPSNDLIWYSSNGTQWFAATDKPFAGGGTVFDVKFYNGLFVAVGKYVDGGTVAAYSTDGNNWTAGTFSNTLAQPIVLDNIQTPYRYSEYWLITGTTVSNFVDGEGLYYTSTDGKNWDLGEQTLFQTGAIRSSAVGFEGRKFDSEARTIIVGQSGSGQNIYYSKERAGISWTAASNASDIFGTASTDTILEAIYT